MEKKLELKLVEKYPKLFQNYRGNKYETCMFWGCSCFDGWYDILDNLFSELSKYDYLLLAQVKEKFGTLRVDLENTREEDLEDVSDMINNAETLSEKTCEFCGNEGRLISTDWWRTICDVCEEKRQYRFEHLKQNFEDDDGYPD